jgi:manganese/iron transport system permease protein
VDLGKLLIEPLLLSYVQRAIVAALLIGAVCGLIGTYLVSRSMAFLSIALTQAIFPGVVIALLLYAGFLVGAVVAGLLTVIGVGLYSRRTHGRWEMAIAVLVAGAFALGVLLFSRLPTYRSDLEAVLVGNILSISLNALVLISILAGLTVAVLFTFYKELLLVSFDRTLAVSQGWPVYWLDRLLLVALAATVIISLGALGTIFVVPLILIPSATARLWVGHFWSAMLLGCFLGALSDLAGLYLAYYLNAPSGATIVLLASAIFLVSFVVSPRRGLLAGRFRS